MHVVGLRAALGDGYRLLAAEHHAAGRGLRTVRHGDAEGDAGVHDVADDGAILLFLDVGELQLGDEAVAAVDGVHIAEHQCGVGRNIRLERHSSISCTSWRSTVVGVFLPNFSAAVLK